MKVVAQTTSQSLSELVWTKLSSLIEDKMHWDYVVITLQNLWPSPIYIEIWEPATIGEWYKVFVWNDVEFKYREIDKINIVAEWAPSDLRIIIT